MNDKNDCGILCKGKYDLCGFNGGELNYDKYTAGSHHWFFFLFSTVCRFVCFLPFLSFYSPSHSFTTPVSHQLSVSPSFSFFLSQDNKDQPNFNSNCRLVVVRRLVEQTTDARLDPQLLNSCRKDLGKFCSKYFDKLNTNATELNGVLTECLRVGASASFLRVTDR